MINAGYDGNDIQYVKSLGARPVITEYSPVPGSAMWKEAVEASPFPLAREPATHNNTIIPCRWEGLTYADYEAIRAECRQR